MELLITYITALSVVLILVWVLSIIYVAQTNNTKVVRPSVTFMMLFSVLWLITRIIS